MKFLVIDVCDKCGGGNLVVHDTRTVNNIRMRRRRCIECNNRFTTYEIRKEDVEKLQYSNNCKEQLINIGNEVSTMIKQLAESE